MNTSNLYDFLLEQIRINDSQNDGLNQLVSSLVEKIEILEKTICSYEDTIKELRDTINLLNRKLYGSKSEKSHSDNFKNGSGGNLSSSGGTLFNGNVNNIKGAGKVRKPYKRPERRTYDDIEERIEILEPDAEELKGAKFVRSEKTFRLYMIPAKIVK